MDRLTLTVVVVALAGGCSRPSRGRVCGLHSASAPVLLESEQERVLAVGAHLSDEDRIRATGWAVVECFTGSLRVLDDERVHVGALLEARTEVKSFPRRVYRGGAGLEDGPQLPPAVASRYSDTRFTPPGVGASDEPTSGDYLRAFFTPGGITRLGSSPRPEGPRTLPPPQGRPVVPRIHAGPLGEGGLSLEVSDDVVFAESADLATAVLAGDGTYHLGRTVRLILPRGAEAVLRGPGGAVELEGPLDLRL